MASEFSLDGKAALVIGASNSIGRAIAVALGEAGVIVDSSAATKIALIWLAHIGADRLLGYGLKYPTTFKDTHLSRV